MENQTNNKRQPRFRRGDKDKIPFRIQKRDQVILGLVFDYRFLTSRHIQRLVPGSDKVILQRLQKLFHHSYLDRIKLSNNDPILYALGNKGADELTLYFGIDRGKIDWAKKNREVRETYLAHSLQINNFRITLTLALKGNPDKEIFSWIPEGDLKDEVVFYGEQQRKVRAPLVPDAFFTLRDQDEGIHFFLEADRSTMTNQRFFNKMRAYWFYWKQGKHKEKLNVGAFRVLTVCKSRARKDNLRLITREVDDQKTGSNMFWFASEEDFNIDDSGSILKPIWQTPKDNELHYLFGD